jgi:hypothetical protein
MEDRQYQLLSRGQVDREERQVEARAGGGKSHSKVYNSDRKAGPDREWGGGLHNRDRS